jgi:hypothetical protein
MTLLHHLFNHKARIAELKAQQAEVARQQSRMNAAYDLHHEVLQQYGYEVWLKLTPPNEIMEGTENINLINYLNI